MRSLPGTLSGYIKCGDPEHPIHTVRVSGGPEELALVTHALGLEPNRDDIAELEQLMDAGTFKDVSVRFTDDNGSFVVMQPCMDAKELLLNILAGGGLPTMFDTQG